MTADLSAPGDLFAPSLVEATTRRLLEHLTTNAPPKNREEEAAKARARAAERYGTAA